MVVREVLKVDLSGNRGFPAVGRRGERFAVGPDEGSAAVVRAGGIAAHAVHGRYIAGVLDGPGARERVPREAPHVGPTGHQQDGVVVVPVAQPHGEAQVVADRQQEAHAAPLHDDAPSARDETLALAEDLGLAENVTGATALLNAGTVYKAFGAAAKGLPLFEKAKAIYETNLAPNDERLPGLYNNMGLVLCDLGRFDEAKVAYEKALRLTETDPVRAGDAAITLLNLANLTEAQKGLMDGNDEIIALLDRAQELLDSEGLPKDGYYAFVCEKCAPTFGYYGYFAYQTTLLSRARSIYEGT